MKKNCLIHYTSLDDNWRKEDKLQWFAENKIKDISFEIIRPDKNNNWINIADNDFETLLPLCSKDAKSGKETNSIFELFSLGVVTNRDEWCYDYSNENLNNKANYFCETFESEKLRWNNSKKDIAINNFVDRKIKWTEELEKHLLKNSKLEFNKARIRTVHYRPFSKKFGYIDKIISHRLYQNSKIWGLENINKNIALVLTIHPQVDLSFFCSNLMIDQGFGSRASSLIPLYQYNTKGNQIENITDWGLEQFKQHYIFQTPTKKHPYGYGDSVKMKKFIKNYFDAHKLNYIETDDGVGLEFPMFNKEDIFYYVYAVLHNPVYRKKYELNLKREFPRIPFYSNFTKWSMWGEQLMNLHLNYESIEKFDLQIIEKNTIENPKTKLKANKENGSIEIDENTTLTGISSIAWQYKLGNRSALEWILDQYKESKPKDPTIAQKFNTYKFANYKQQVIDLLQRVCTVSVKTMEIIGEMEKEKE